MEGSKVILIENKFSEISTVGSRALRIIEHGRKVTKQLVLSFSSMKWGVMQTLESCFHAESSRKFIRTSSSGNSPFIA